VSRSLPNLGNQAGTQANLRKGCSASKPEPRNKEIDVSFMRVLAIPRLTIAWYF
jgi:hypothetical protein